MKTASLLLLTQRLSLLADFLKCAPLLLCQRRVSIMCGEAAGTVCTSKRKRVGLQKAANCAATLSILIPAYPLKGNDQAGLANPRFSEQAQL